MVYSKQNLQLHTVASEDKEIIGLDQVCFEPDGSTAALNRHVVMVVGPVDEVMRKNFPLDSTVNDSPESILNTTVRDIVKGLNRDNTFGGILEHVDMCGGKFTFTDGVRTSTTETKVYPREFPDYKAILKRANGTKKDVRVGVNLRRLKSAIETIEKVCGADDSTALFLEFSKDNDIIIRCINPKTLQRVIAVMNSYDRTGGNWMEHDKWESKVFGETVEEKPKKIQREKIKREKA